MVSFYSIVQYVVEEPRRSEIQWTKSVTINCHPNRCPRRPLSQRLSSPYFASLSLSLITPVFLFLLCLFFLLSLHVLSLFAPSFISARSIFYLRFTPSFTYVHSSLFAPCFISVSLHLFTSIHSIFFALFTPCFISVSFHFLPLCTRSSLLFLLHILSLSIFFFVFDHSTFF